MASVWWDECEFIHSMADARFGRVFTEIVRERCSVVYAESSANETWFSGIDEDEDLSAVRLGSSQRRRTLAFRRPSATLGQMVERTFSWMIRVSAALHAEG
jgi:hypothetical protein